MPPIEKVVVDVVQLTRMPVMFAVAVPPPHRDDASLRGGLQVGCA